MKKRRLLALQIPLLAAGSALFLLGAAGNARADQSSLNAGYIFYGTTQGKSLSGSGGYALSFVSETSGNFVRPAIGVQIEYGSGTVEGGESASVTAGSVLFGGHFYFFKTAYVRPFMTTEGMLGWGYMGYGTDSSIGLTYGINLGGGTELRFKDDPKGKALRISTSYRKYMTTFNVVPGFEFDGVSFAIGMSF